jgi:tetratricopeptide (TPR) repeat protein
MDVKEKINQFCQKIEVMMREMSTNNLGVSFLSPKANLSVLVMIYKSALELYATDGSCLEVLERLFAAAENQDIQNAFMGIGENEIQILSNFAETFIASGKPSESAKLFQFLTLLCPRGVPNPYAYLRLTESLALLNIDTGSQMYDFILNIFPDNPSILLSAAKCYYETERPKRSLRVLNHAKEICERHSESNPEFQKFLDLISPELLKIQGEVGAKK